MPVYIALTKRKLTEKQKQDISNKITDIHCSVTGAPSAYVTITFLSGYHLRNKNKLTLLGNIRIGGNRTQELIEKLRFELVDGIASILTLQSTRVGVDFLGVKPNWVFEGGTVLSEPGKEKY